VKVGASVAGYHEIARDGNSNADFLSPDVLDSHALRGALRSDELDVIGQAGRLHGFLRQSQKRDEDDRNSTKDAAQVSHGLTSSENFRESGD
jgi:hypothetical protein